ncbi:hypothetical protein Q73_12390 [Bacillus coahuilensis m2-6]|uniref:DUF1836 domain-containing protein n=1 Tax=Bacillus coahuilensis p1.1.43 TaxID=1150625 RepID=A0A147K5U1_9BACI|nr:DUF1836 domain-containing protein [Bacillus coahuilensis]KUP05173.1 hypothetical protein Q75_12995 [Bacillus coahuilensis p1.1.43]KUP05623.1 hypothetical protein Q73_12390 [Bacillus coahuilensis m2-6]
MKSKFDQMEWDQHLHLEDIPDIDLYMDQVIQLFEKSYEGSKRNDNDKILTKTMINNYAKGKLFYPITNKKYSKDHLILISLIYQLKGTLSIQDIKETLLEVNEKAAASDLSLPSLYEQYLQLFSQNVEKFKNDLNLHEERVKELGAGSENTGLQGDSDQDIDHLQSVLLVLSLVNMSNFYRRAAETLVDQLGNDRELLNEKHNEKAPAE